MMAVMDVATHCLSIEFMIASIAIFYKPYNRKADKLTKRHYLSVKFKIEKWLSGFYISTTGKFLSWV